MSGYPDDEAREVLRKTWERLPNRVHRQQYAAKQAAAAELVQQAAKLLEGYGFAAAPATFRDASDPVWTIEDPGREDEPLVVRVDFKGDLAVGFRAHSFGLQRAKAPLQVKLTYDPALRRFFGPKLGRAPDGAPIYRSALAELVEGLLACIEGGPTT